MPTLNKEANTKFLEGDGINDEELRNLRKFYQDLEVHLDLLNAPEFALMHNEVRRRTELLDGFARARGLRDKRKSGGVTM